MKKALFSFCLVLLISCTPKTHDYLKMEGMIFGTFYHIIYQPVKENDLINKGVANELSKVDWALSTFKDTSTISRFNVSEKGSYVDSMLKYVYQSGVEINRNTEGAFDMTVAPLVNAWGFGFKKKDSITSLLIDSLLMNVGMEKIQLKENFLSKSKPGIMFDASAIAKGYGVDVVADYLGSQGIDNYMVEIGGEIRVHGVNNKGIAWRVGIDKPIDDRAAVNREIQDVLSLTNVGLATSGNYRNFYIKDGQKYAHTIDPKTGYPVQHSLLSASIIAPECMVADGYATACMVMGVEKSMEVISALPGIEGYFIYVDDEGNNQVKYTEGFKDYVVK
ncbi:FAD:protein FMN transferase [Plebeiibacterium sediminum]|uniref:FAD:protein FMN transferase n=1 Tax=Plebeiibacterium sediminum TaxID=2992112 RepID=A0AAE3M679_9BACT|nr:FAD:protein FMN transferase [Plebeiobacterium sediminum]MCW3787539.1 FAD:protein FMN transferase [Plebeiobacterium sediminum]